MKRIFIATAIMAVFGGAISLSACTPEPRETPPTPANEETTDFTLAPYPVKLRADASLERITAPQSGYFDTGSWQIMDDAPGERLITLALPGSNDITAAHWRLGASHDAKAISNCLTPPPNAHSRSTASIDSHDFQAFTLDDAGMSHFQQITGYRAVIDDTCYAIDLIVNGTRGDVYDPPREPPFSSNHAMQRLREINDGLTLP
ncbi:MULTISPECIES: hypothetical protein [Chromohalobacter]|uniref:Lipoprotein n=1 Tax=Chromohalobacter beijerinckii TaxID=86179 RepID=A0ABV8XAR1_9GAMM|nr:MULTISPECIES: hypothetical protein [Chromohalobacter]MCK0751915.1 hypothetical protein [Chromohalobacter japonicus]MCK0765265.1 hypothetical protein [Chromohalobacter beijerinckii]